MPGKIGIRICKGKIDILTKSHTPHTVRTVIASSGSPPLGGGVRGGRHEVPTGSERDNLLISLQIKNR